MKLYYVMGLLLLGVLWCKASEKGLQEELFKKVGSLFVKKCRLADGFAAVQKNLTNAAQAAMSCVTEHFSGNKLTKLQESDSDSSKQRCNNQRRGQFRECFHYIIEIWKDCFQPEEKYLPDFAFDAMKAIDDYECADEEAFNKKVANANSVDCLSVLMERKYNATDVCDEKFNILNADNLEEMIITKTELCEDLELANTCFGAYIKQECPDATDFKNLVDGLFAAVKSPCDKKHKRDLLYSFKFNN